MATITSRTILSAVAAAMLVAAQAAVAQAGHGGPPPVGGFGQHPGRQGNGVILDYAARNDLTKTTNVNSNQRWANDGDKRLYKTRAAMRASGSQPIYKRGPLIQR